MPEPIIYPTLLDSRTASIIAALDSVVGDDALARVADAVRKAYVRGVIDGFTQGVAAESDRRDAKPKKPGAAG